MSPTDGDETSKLLADIPQSANRLGDPAAPVALEYFGDLECPFCRDFSLDILPSIIERWVRSRELRIAYRALQTATRDPGVFLAQQVAALAAGEQDKAWHFIHRFYAEQGEEGSGYVTESYLEGIASQIPHLDIPRWVTARENPRLVQEIASDADAASQAGLTGTPSFLLGASGSAMRPFSPTGRGSFDAAIKALVGRT